MKKTIVVADRFRKNEMSLRPGGSTVTVIQNDGLEKVYKNIKYVESYVKKFKNDPKIVEIKVNGKPYWKR